MFTNTRLFAFFLLLSTTLAAKVHIVSGDGLGSFKRPSIAPVKEFTLDLNEDGSVKGDGYVSPVWNSVYQSKNGPIGEQIEPVVGVVLPR